ncbi:MAG: hypothetical protein OXH31_05930 [Gammaproteobacteria bacterium]|nr:hypothetical protein [Gammaproteobacteria bacterium]
MNIEVKDVPLSVDLLYRYLLNTDLFPVGYKGGLEKYLEKILREHERRGGLPATEPNPRQMLASCMKLLRNRGYFNLPHRDSWERIEFKTTKTRKDQDDANNAALVAASMLPFISS